jgi:hypothetical protein
MDEHLRTIWTDGVKLYSSVVHHDLSKDIGNHPSNNNNEVVKVLDKNTSINDWVDAVIDTEIWPDKTPMIIQIKNGSSVKYYDQDSETFVDNIVFFYPQKNERYRANTTFLKRITATRLNSFFSHKIKNNE